MKNDEIHLTLRRPNHDKINELKLKIHTVIIQASTGNSIVSDRSAFVSACLCLQLDNHDCPDLSPRLEALLQTNLQL